MVDRLYGDNSTANFHGASASTFASSNPTSNVTLSLDGLYRDSTRLLNMVASGATLPFNYDSSNNNNIQDLLSAATNKLQGLQQQNLTLDTMNSLTHASLLADLKRKFAPYDTNIRLSSAPQAQIPQALGIYRNENTSGIALQDNRQSLLLQDEVTNKVSLSNKRPLSSSFASDDEPNTKKIRSDSSFMNSTDMVLPLSEGERKASFPLPPVSGHERLPNIKILSSKSSSSSSPSASISLRNLWDKYEKMSDDMDDTIADQQAFVKKLFILSLHNSSSRIIEKKIQNLKKSSSITKIKISNSKKVKKINSQSSKSIKKEQA